MNASNKLRLAVLGSRGYPSTYGGFETFVRRFAPYAANEGHEVTVYGRASKPLRSQTRFVHGVRAVDTIGVDSKSLSTLSHGLTASLHAAFAQHDVVLVLNVANGYYLRLLGLARTPTVLNVDGLEWERAKWGRGARAVFRAGARLSARYATSLVADSEVIGDVWHATMGRKPIYIPYGADIVEPRPSDLAGEEWTALGVEPGRYALAVARLVPENNVELTLDALERLANPPLLVVVGDANFRSPLVQRLRDLAAKNRVLWLGHVSDQQLLTDLWTYCGVYIHGHSVGGTNPALLQALGAGAATLALRTPFNEEVVGSTFPGLYEGSSESLARLIRETLDVRTLGEDLVERGKTIISERYQWSAVLDAYLRELERVACLRYP